MLVDDLRALAVARFPRRAACAIALSAALSHAASAQSYRDELRPAALGGVVLSIGQVRQSHDLPPQAARLIRERMGQLFASGGFEAIGAETPYMLRIVFSAPPTAESDTSSGFNRSIAVLAEVALQLEYVPNGMVLKEWGMQLPGTGRDRVDAIDNAFRAMRNNMTRYVEVAREARDLVLRHVDTSCEELRKRAAERAIAGKFEHAVAQLLLVPDEATRCHMATIGDAATLLASRVGANPPTDTPLPRAPAGGPVRDPARYEWPLVAGAEIAAKFVNANRHASERGERIW